MAKIKICGLRRLEDVSYVNRTQPDYVGFILSSGFRRSIDEKTAKQLVDSLHRSIKKVGVFVDEPAENVNRLAQLLGLDYVQLHGNETPDYCKRIDTSIIKVFKPNSFDIISDYDDCADYYLLDSGTGTGKAFDWQTIPNVSKLFFLAGGIDSKNIASAIKNIQPFAVDLSSSVETDGYKDYEKIKQIIDIVRNV